MIRLFIESFRGDEGFEFLLDTEVDLEKVLAWIAGNFSSNRLSESCLEFRDKSYSLYYARTAEHLSPVPPQEVISLLKRSFA